MPTMRPRLSQVSNYPAYLAERWQEHLVERGPDAPTVISTFAGAGGSSLGYSMAGFRELLAIEWDDNAVATFRLNFPHVPVYHGDIGKLSVEQCLALANIAPGDLDVFDGSPPCQGFSTAGRRQMEDPRNQLFREYVRLIRGLKPKVIVMENVSGMVKGKMKLLFADILRELKSAGYKVSARLMNAMYFGVPQARQRMIFIGVREDLEKPASHPLAVTLPIAAARAIDGLSLDGMAAIAKESHRELWHKCQAGKSFASVHPKKHYFNSVKASPFRPFQTVTKTVFADGSSGMFHWDVPALLSIAMLKRAASFPDEFLFIGEFKEQWARIGNSVPPLLMRAIAAHIRHDILN